MAQLPEKGFGWVRRALTGGGRGEKYSVQNTKVAAGQMSAWQQCSCAVKCCWNAKLHCTLVSRPGGHWEQAEEGKIHQKPFGLAWAGILKNSLESARILWNSQESARTLWDQVATDRQGKIEGSGWAYIFPILQPFYLISSRNSWCSRREPAGWAPLHFFCCCLHLL